MSIRKNSFLALPLAAIMIAPVAAQSTQNDQNQNQSTQQVQNQVDTQTTQTAQTGPATQTTTVDAHQPLELQQKEGFWGKLNPFARKKYVRRQMAPVVGRVNELDELTAANGKNIKDVDARATEGIRLANLKVSEADSHAVEAGNRADLAHQTATQANTRIQSVEGALQNVDQYKPVTEAEIRFRPGQTMLSKKAKAALDEIATAMKDQKGMILEVQGFSAGKGTASVENSQHLASSVVRYMVIEHEIPVYRIYTVGMGNAPLKTTDGKNRRLSGGRVEVSLLKNGVADLNQQMAQGANAAPAEQNQAAPANSTAPATQGYGVNSNSNLPQGDQPAQQKQPEQKQQEPQEKPKSDQPK
jgi:hypothetical protein